MIAKMSFVSPRLIHIVQQASRLVGNNAKKILSKLAKDNFPRFECTESSEEFWTEKLLENFLSKDKK
jgi:hypothetical protein